MKILCALIVLVATFAATAVFGEEQPARAAAPAPVPAPNEIVARVGNREITRKELALAVQALQSQVARSGRLIPQEQIPALEQRIVDDMIGRELILREGLAHPPAGLDAKIQQGLEQVQSQLGGGEGLSNALTEAGLTFDEYVKRARENVIVQETMRAMLEREVKVTAEEIKAFYETNREKMKWPESVRASHILLRVPPDASADIKRAKRVQIEAARSLIVSGDKFADVARKVSEDPGSASAGGDLGFFTRGQMVPEFDEAAFSLKTNELSGVITTQFGYHVLLVTDRKPARPASLDEVKDDIEKTLRYRKSSEVTQQHVKELRDKVKVEVFLKPLAPVADDSTPAARALVSPAVPKTPASPAPKP